MNALFYWTPEEDNLLKKLYSEKATKEQVLKSLPGRTYSSTKYRAKTLKIKKIRLQYKNELFFETPNLINSALAGYIASDGNIKKPKNNYYEVSLCTATKDIQILRDFLATVESNATIRTYITKKTIKTSRCQDNEEKEYSASWINFSGAKKWTEDLEKHWNIVPNKSLILKRPNLEDLDLSLAYLSGLIDGDGSIGIQRNKDKKYLYIRILGTKNVVEWSKCMFEQLLNEKILALVDLERPESNIYHLQINGFQAARIHNKLYSMPIPRLKRKWENPDILKLVEDLNKKNNQITIQKIEPFLKQYSIDYVKEMDFIHIPDKNFIIRVVSLEGENGINDQKDFLKQSKNQRIIQIFESELLFKPKIVFSRLKHYLGLIKRKIHARKCEIKYIDFETKNKFLNKYHIQGQDYGSNVFLGLFYRNRLVNVMTFSKKNNDYELSRFSGINHFNVMGGAGKLLSFFEKTYKPSHLFSFADKRWSVGNLYIKLNFILTKEGEPSYFYFKSKDKKLHHKFGFRHKFLNKKLENYDPNQTEWQNMSSNGWRKIYDCGLIKFEKSYQNTLKPI